MYKSLSRGMRAALDFLEREDLPSLQPGRHDIIGDACYANVSSYSSKPEEQGVWEAHRKYIDVQYVLSGRERIGFSCIDKLKVCKEYDEEQDYLLLEGNGDFALVESGMFAVFAPQDAHMPGIAVESPGPVRKIVVKVRL
jgi:YhcH/YjgK/YiaL family protein